MTQILIKLRDLIGDNLVQTQEVQEYLGGAKTFTLSYSSIDSTTLVVLKNNVIWAASNYSYSSVTSKVTVTGTLATGDNLTFEYQAYTKYSTNELRGYIRSAIYHLAVEKYKTFTAKTDNIVFPTPSEAEESLIAIVAAILIKGSIKMYKTPEFSITFNDNVSVEDKIKQTLRSYKHAFGYITYIDLTSEMAETEDN